jgi:hypothetical protein
MMKVLRSCSSILLAVALAAGVSAGCAAEPEEQAVAEQASPLIEASAPAISPAFQVVFVCFDSSDSPVGLPKGTLAECRAACPAGGFCERCTLRNNAVECP